MKTIGLTFTKQERKKFRIKNTFSKIASFFKRIFKWIFENILSIISIVIAIIALIKQ